MSDGAPERPGNLRSNLVEKYVYSVFGGKDPVFFKKSFNVTKKMIQLQIDNRVLN